MCSDLFSYPQNRNDGSRSFHRKKGKLGRAVRGLLAMLKIEMVVKNG